MDFGVSKWSSSAQTLTRVGGVVGTPRYMSPEQARGEAVDRRADIYGLGAVLYRVLTGRPPFTGRGNAVLFSAAHRRPPRPRTVAPELSRQLEAVLAIAMAPSPRDRFTDIAELRKAFGQAITDQLPISLLQKARTIPWRASNLEGA